MHATAERALLRELRTEARRLEKQGLERPQPATIYTRVMRARLDLVEQLILNMQELP